MDGLFFRLHWCSMMTYGKVTGGGYVDIFMQPILMIWTFLMSQGADIHQCIKFIDSIIRGAGPAVSSILGQKQVSKRWEGLIQLAEALHVQVPDVMRKLSKAKTKMKRTKLALQMKTNNFRWMSQSILSLVLIKTRFHQIHEDVAPLPPGYD